MPLRTHGLRLPFDNCICEENGGWCTRKYENEELTTGVPYSNWQLEVLGMQKPIVPARRSRGRKS